MQTHWSSCHTDCISVQCTCTSWEDIKHGDEFFKNVWFFLPTRLWLWCYLELSLCRFYNPLVFILDIIIDVADQSILLRDGWGYARFNCLLHLILMRFTMALTLMLFYLSLFTRLSSLLFFQIESILDASENFTRTMIKFWMICWLIFLWLTGYISLPGARSERRPKPALWLADNSGSPIPRCLQNSQCWLWRHCLKRWYLLLPMPTVAAYYTAHLCSAQESSPSVPWRRGSSRLPNFPSVPLQVGIE